MNLWNEYTFGIIIVGAALLGLTAGVVGTFAVLRKESLIGDGLSHAALPGIALAFLWSGTKDTVWLLTGAAVSSLITSWLIALTVRYTKIKFDAILATLLSSFFGFGMVLLTYIQSLDNASQAGLTKFIFGQAASMMIKDVYLTSAAAVLIILLVLIFWKELKLTSFDEEYARTLQIPVTSVTVLYRGMLLLTVIIGIQTVGAVLISSLLIAPAAAARQWTDKLGTMITLAGFFGALSGIGGVIWSASVTKLPTGPAIIVCLSTIVFISLLFSPKYGIIYRGLRRCIVSYERTN